MIFVFSYARFYYMKQWNDKPYHSLDYELKKRFGEKVYRLTLNGGMSCPNRDGHIGYGGCIFCSGGGSGEFAANPSLSIQQQIKAGRQMLSAKRPVHKYIAYFQAFTNTYAPVSRLKDLFTETILQPDIAALSVATRPDCLEPEKVRLLGELSQIKPVWTELGHQTIHPDTAAFIRRGYPLSCFDDAVRRLKAAGLTVIVHLILGLPGESREQMLESVKYLAHFSPPIDGIKLQLLHVLKGTELARLYEHEPFPLFSLDEYADFVITCLEYLPPTMVIHRLTGDGPKKLLPVPAWSMDKKKVLNTFTKRFRERNTWQGRYFSDL